MRTQNFLPPNPILSLTLSNTPPQFDFTAEYDRYAGRPRPDPRLLALGAQVGSVREFAEEVLKPYLNGKAKETR